MSVKPVSNCPPSCNWVLEPELIHENLINICSVHSTTDQNSSCDGRVAPCVIYAL